MTNKLKKIVSVCLAVLMLSGTISGMTLTATAAETQVLATGETSGDFEYETYGDTVEITGYTGVATEVTIPSEIEGKKVTSIGWNAFGYCDSLESITIPDSVISIGDNAFCDCTSLTSVTIPDSVAEIGDYAFENCTSLESVTMLGSVAYLPYTVFSGCENLKQIFGYYGTAAEIVANDYFDGNVQFISPEIIGIKVAEIPNNGCFIANSYKSKFDFDVLIADAEVQIIFADGVTVNMYDSIRHQDVFDIITPAELKIGENTVKVSYRGFKTEVTLTGVETPLESIEVRKLPDKVFSRPLDVTRADEWDNDYQLETDYLHYGICFNLFGAEFALHYKDGTTKMLYMRDDRLGSGSIAEPFSAWSQVYLGEEGRDDSTWIYGRDLGNYQADIEILGCHTILTVKAKDTAGCENTVTDRSNVNYAVGKTNMKDIVYASGPKDEGSMFILADSGNTLYVTTDYMNSFTNANLQTEAEKYLGDKAKCTFFRLKTIEDEQYVLGYYYIDNGEEQFFPETYPVILKTSDGVNFSKVETPKEENMGYSMYQGFTYQFGKIKDKYYLVYDCFQLSEVTKVDSSGWIDKYYCKGVYYISKDLTKWEHALTPEVECTYINEAMFELEFASDEGLCFSYSENIQNGGTSEYEKQQLLVYTTDFVNYTDIKEPKIENIAKSNYYATSANNIAYYRTDTERVYTGLTVAVLNMDTFEYEVVFEYDAKERYGYISDYDDESIFIACGTKENPYDDVYVVDLTNNSSVKNYESSIDFYGRKAGFCEIDNEYSVMLFDYELYLSNDNYYNSYCVKLPEKCNDYLLINDYLLVVGENSDYLYRVSDIVKGKTDSKIVLKDKDTNVSVEGEIDENVELNVENAETVVENAVAAYNITLQKNGEAVQPDGKVTVKLPVPDGVDGSQCKVYNIDGDNKTDMNAVFENGFLVFETDHFSIYAIVSTEESSLLLGDVDGDGKVNIKDVTMIQRTAASIITLTDVQTKFADVNKDGKVNVNDATAIQKYTAGIDTGLDIGK